MFRAYDKTNGKEVGAVWMPAPQSGSPMTYMANGRQYFIVAVSGGNYSGEYIAFALPQSEVRPTSQAGASSASSASETQVVSRGFAVSTASVRFEGPGQPGPFFLPAADSAAATTAPTIAADTSATVATRNDG